jgi:NAD(P)-dependent dehydrogenase (short-subunit alcohol dehydrogenase family)
MRSLKGQVALVTGAGRGNGRVIAEGLAARGALIAANDLTPVNLDPLLESLEERSQRAQMFLADISKKMQVQAMLESIVEAFGRLDLIVGNARVEPKSALLEMDEWAWDRTVAVNLKGAFLTLQSAARIMRQGDGGVYIHVVPLRASARGQGGWSAPTVASSGALALIRAAAVEMKPYNIRVYALCPLEGVEVNGEVGSESWRSVAATYGLDPRVDVGRHMELPAWVEQLFVDQEAFPSGEAIIVMT